MQVPSATVIDKAEKGIRMGGLEERVTCGN